MQGFIESIIGEVDAMEKQIAMEDTNLFESYELDSVVVLEEDDIDLEDDLEDIDEEDDIDLEDDLEDIDEEDDIDLEDIDEEDEIDLEDLDEGYFSKESRYKRLTKKANKANNKFLKASANKNKADLKLNKFKSRHNL